MFEVLIKLSAAANGNEGDMITITAEATREDLVAITESFNVTLTFVDNTTGKHYTMHL